LERFVDVDSWNFEPKFDSIAKTTPAYGIGGHDSGSVPEPYFVCYVHAAVGRILLSTDYTDMSICHDWRLRLPVAEKVFVETRRMDFVIPGTDLSAVHLDAGEGHFVVEFRLEFGLLYKDLLPVDAGYSFDVAVAAIEVFAVDAIEVVAVAAIEVVAVAVAVVIDVGLDLGLCDMGCSYSVAIHVGLSVGHAVAVVA